MTKFNRFLPFALCLALTACKKESVVKEPIPVDSVAQLTAMNQSFGWKVFSEEQRSKPDENILISPFSIQTALQMATNGAKDNTLEEILKALDCPGCSVSDLNRLHKNLTAILTEQSGHPTLKVTNGFFYDKKRIDIKIPFTQTLDTQFACGVGESNFDAEQAALNQINTWVRTNTLGKIDKLLDKITPLDVAFLINALHFKADWATGFASEVTRKAAFKKADGTEVQVDFVNADRKFNFAQTANFNLVDIPFKDSTYSISFIQPSAANKDANWRFNITAASWRSMYDGILFDRAQLYFPKLKLAYDNDLIKSLKTLGVNDAFLEQAANFKDMGTAAKNVFINQIKHKAVLEVDEKGAEGAAVTSIGFGTTSVPPTFWFNRPFVLVLRHIPTNTMIFTGYVANPVF